MVGNICHDVPATAEIGILHMVQWSDNTTYRAEFCPVTQTTVSPEYGYEVISESIPNIIYTHLREYQHVVIWNYIPFK